MAPDLQGLLPRCMSRNLQEQQLKSQYYDGMFLSCKRSSMVSFEETTGETGRDSGCIVAWELLFDI